MPRKPTAQLPEADPEVERSARALAEAAPEPARVGSVLCGTAGWTDPTLISCGRFYPSAVASPAQRLAHYANHFPVVEVDSTYYAIPAPQVAQHWCERTPDNFIFDIKAHPIFSGHPLDRQRLPRDLQDALTAIRPESRRLYPKDVPDEVSEELRSRFRLLLEPLVHARKLGCVMVQLPPWTTSTRGAVRELERLPELLPSVAIAVEFRHPSWLEPTREHRVFDMLRAHKMAFVSVDEPNVRGGGVPPVVCATRDDLGVVRFHGHNIGGWHPGASVHERFNYLYSSEQITAWSAPIKRLAQQAGRVHAIFNNCVRDYAQVNAKDLAAALLLEEPENQHPEEPG